MPDPEKSSGGSLRFHLLVVAIFAFGYAAILFAFGQSFPPQPMYERAEEHPSQPFIELQDDVPIAWEFAAGGPIRTLFLGLYFPDDKGELEVVVENASRDTELTRQVFPGPMAEIAVQIPSDATIAATDQVRVTCTILQSQKKRFPTMTLAIKRAHREPWHPLKGFRDGVEVSAPEEMMWPLFHAHYRSNFDWAHKVWWLPLLLLVGLYFLPPARHWTAIWLLVLGLIVAFVSLTGWFHRYSYHSTYDDPDQYGEYGKAIHTVLSNAPNSDAHQEADQWIQGYAHAHVPLTPLLIAGLKFLGIPMLHSFAWWAAFCTFFALVLLHWFATQRIHLHWRTALLVVAAGAYHVILLRAFGKVSTDPSGFLFAIAGLAILFERSQKAFTLSGEIWFALFLLALALSRPPGIACAGLIIAVAWVTDHLRGASQISGWELVGLVAAASIAAPFGLLAFGAIAGALALGWFIVRFRHLTLNAASILRPIAWLIPILVVYGIGLAFFDWKHNMELNIAKSKAYQPFSDWEHFSRSLPMTLYPLLAAIPFLFCRQQLRSPAAWQAVIWVVGFVAILTVFQAPFYTRLFLPALAGVLVLTAILMDGIVRRFTTLPLILTLSLAIVGGAAVQWVLSFPSWPNTAPDSPIAGLEKWIFF